MLLCISKVQMATSPNCRLEKDGFHMARCLLSVEWQLLGAVLLPIDFYELAIKWDRSNVYFRNPPWHCPLWTILPWLFLSLTSNILSSAPQPSLSFLVNMESVCRIQNKHHLSMKLSMNPQPEFRFSLLCFHVFLGHLLLFMCLLPSSP